jgi:nucleotide-binding universal stress UspA family protein
MVNLESALSDAKERQSLFEKIWPTKTAKGEFVANKILCFVDANEHSSDGIQVSLQLAEEFKSEFVIRSIFDKELKKLTSEDLSHLKQSVIELVKINLKEKGISKGVTFLEGDAIESVSRQLISEYDIIVLPIPYHSNLSSHPDAVALGTLGEYLVRHSEKPLFLVPSIEGAKEDLFSSMIIVANDVSDIILNENYINAISRNRSQLNFVYLYDARDIEILAQDSDGVVDVDLVKRRVHDKMKHYGEMTVNRFKERITSVEYSIFNENFSDNIQTLIKQSATSLLTIILPENVAGHRYLLYQEMLRDKKLNVPILILRMDKEKKAPIEIEELEIDSQKPDEGEITEEPDTKESTTEIKSEMIEEPNEE